MISLLTKIRQIAGSVLDINFFNEVPCSPALWRSCSDRQLQSQLSQSFGMSVWPTQAWNTTQKLLEAIHFELPAYFPSAASPFHLEATPVSFLIDEVNWYEWAYDFCSLLEWQRSKWKNCVKSLNEGFGFHNRETTSAQWISLKCCMPKNKPSMIG